MSQTHPFGPASTWQRLFRVQGLRFLVCDVWMDHYQTLGALCVVSDDFYTSYLPFTTVEQTHREGSALVTDGEAFEAFEAFESEFRKYMVETRELAEHFPYDVCTREEAKTLLDTIARLFFYYSKTEFFYTDGAYEKAKQLQDEQMFQRLERWGKLKYEGREFLNWSYFGAQSVLSKFLDAVATRFSVAARELQQYNREEILSLFDGRHVSADDIVKRELSFYVFGKDEGEQIKTGQEAKREIDAFQHELENGSNEVKGMTANPGRARGRARVIVSGYDNFDALHHFMDAMQQGEVLIAETTSPELMPACVKAGAIVTDQGGILSHAAIVSRELGIPCIVGTGRATQAIKDGVEIEVDADHGIVRIL